MMKKIWTLVLTVFLCTGMFGRDVKAESLVNVTIQDRMWRYRRRRLFFLLRGKYDIHIREIKGICKIQRGNICNLQV